MKSLAIHASLLLILNLAKPSIGYAQETADGERLFRQRCATCHAVEPAQNRAGPTLAGVFGRRAGQVAGARYSRGMQGSEIVWDEASLDRYLANPRQVVPDTTMLVPLQNAAERRAIIGYLRTLSQP